MAKLLVLASIVWPTVMGLTVWRTADGHPGMPAALVYVVASRVCHQKPERSFHSAGVQWPVCARCSGLYLAAPIGALTAFLSRRRTIRRSRTLTWLAIGCAPTAITFGLEFVGLAAPSNLVRAIAALPTGAMLAFTIVRTAAGAPASIE